MNISPNIIRPDVLRTIYIALWLASSVWGLGMCLRNWRAARFRLRLARGSAQSRHYLRG